MGFYQITQLKMPLEHKDSDILRVLKKQYGFRGDVAYTIKKKSVDARKKQAIKIVYNLNVHSPKLPGKALAKVPYALEEKSYKAPELSHDSHEAGERPVIVGAGPAGLFAGLILAEAGAKPIIFERGQAADERLETVTAYFEGGPLNTESNIQFGEGGAGTFSDGKINSGVKDRYQRMDKILKTFHAMGAPEEILYVSKPHIGTDYLVEVVMNLRRRILALGGDVHFNTKVTEILCDGGKIEGLRLATGEEVRTHHLVLAIGHSARDTFEMLAAKQVPMMPKAFAIGLRIEHPQAMIARAQYGDQWQHRHLPVADYKLTHRTEKGRGVYSFCMCPGGFVVNAASEKGRLVCNGMSNFARDEANANSAILVNVHPEDFGGDGVLAGVAFQRQWEEKAFALGGGDYSLPVQSFGSFLADKGVGALGEIQPNIKGPWRLADLNQGLPGFVSEAIKEGVQAFGGKIQGFDREDAVLTGIESRSSSPVRILRDGSLMSPIEGLYPCGEGAGFAGGIMSAALDGIKVAEALIERMNQETEGRK